MDTSKWQLPDLISLLEHTKNVVSSGSVNDVTLIQKDQLEREFQKATPGTSLWKSLSVISDVVGPTMEPVNRVELEAHKQETLNLNQRVLDEIEKALEAAKAVS